MRLVQHMQKIGKGNLSSILAIKMAPKSLKRSGRDLQPEAVQQPQEFLLAHHSIPAGVHLVERFVDAAA